MTLPRCGAPEPVGSPHGWNGWMCERVRWHFGRHRFGQYVWPVPCGCGCPPGPHADYCPSLASRWRGWRARRAEARR